MFFFSCLGMRGAERLSRGVSHKGMKGKAIVKDEINFLTKWLFSEISCSQAKNIDVSEN